MLKIDELVVVEGKYDKSRLSSFVDAMIIQTDGFKIFKDKEKRALIRAVAKKNGVVILTDSDHAGFKIRSFIKSFVGDAKVTHVYIPEILGKEKRKTKPSREGLLGVEGLENEVLLEAFKKAGIGKKTGGKEKRAITKLDFYEDGLTGGKDSRAKRDALLSALSLPSKLSSNALLEAVNVLLGYDEYKRIIRSIGNSQDNVDKPI